jgi:hypothetical protein
MTGNKDTGKERYRRKTGRKQATASNGYSGKGLTEESGNDQDQIFFG